MVITHIGGGLGNQLFQYAIGRSVSLKNNDILKLDNIDYKIYHHHYGFRLYDFNISAPLATEAEINRIGTRNERIRLLHRLGWLKYKRSLFVEKQRSMSMFDKRVFKYKTNLYLSGYWFNQKYFIDIRDTLLNDLKLRTQISAEAKSHLKHIKSVNSVAVHIRYADKPSDCYKKAQNYIPNDLEVIERPLFYNMNFDYYHKAIARIKSMQADLKFFIFSNDQKRCKAQLGASIENAVFIDDTKNELEDMELMRNAKHNIAANSTFSWWCAWLNENPNQIVIAPQIWIPNYYEVEATKIWFPNLRKRFLKDSRPSFACDYDPCPKSWIRIENQFNDQY